MILTSTQNSHLFDVLATALIQQHPKIHLEDRREQDRSAKGEGKWKRHARLAEQDEESEHEESEDEGESEVENKMAEISSLYKERANAN